jgi:type I restriction-modification system DNA methylase subunit
MANRKKAPDKRNNGATVGYESQLWQMADALRGSMDAGEYKHVVLGLIFLKYISDAFEEYYAKLIAQKAQGADPEDPDEYRAHNIFWVPPEARWPHFKAKAKQPTIGRIVDDAMTGIERDNPSLKDVLPKDYARPALDKTRLGQLIDLISNIQVGDQDARSRDVLGRVYEYFLSQFASAEGKKGGEFYANPPFNISDWGGDRLRDDKRWRYGVPPTGNANFAWVQHMVHHLAPAGVAGFVLANGSMSSNQSGEGEIRKNLIEAELVDCMVAMPGQLFYSTQIPACLWFLARDRKNGKFRNRCGQVLFIDTRKLGRMADRTHRELTDEDIARIARTYHAWRGEKGAGKFEDILGFCKSASLEEIHKHGYVLTPGRYIGAEVQEDDGEPFDRKMKHLTGDLKSQFDDSEKLQEAIKKNMKGIGYEL